MFGHEPAGYGCPFCALVAGVDSEVSDQQDIVARTDEAVAFIAARWWPNNHGHVLVVPTEHHESLYDLPAPCGHAVHDLVQRVAVALRQTYGCDGTSTRQHNEPEGGQDVWHYHVHVFPRYKGDDLYSSKPYPEFVAARDRRPFANKLRAQLSRQLSER